jgi:hypothetical protein
MGIEMKLLEVRIAVSALIVVALAGTTVVAQEYASDKEKVASTLVKAEYSPYAGRDFPTEVLWGDSHLHTAISVDAGTMCTLGQEEAFRFARGEEVVTTHGLRAKLARPLDWIVVSDHAEMYGLMPQLLKGDPEILATEMGKKWYDMLKTGDKDTIFEAAMEIVVSLSKPEPPIKNDTAVKNAWQDYRLRVHDEGRRQPAPQRDLPRRRLRRQPDGPVLAVRQPEPRRPLAGAGEARGIDRRRRPRHSAQRQPLQRPHVLGGDR